MPLPDTDALTDPRRLAALAHAGLFDTLPEEAFDRITRIAARVLSAPVAFFTLVGADRQFFKSQVGMGEPWATLRETPLTHSFCQHTVRLRRPFVVPDARQEPLVASNRAIEELGVVAYLGIPLISAAGEALGAFCVADGNPREWSEEDIATLRDLAELVRTEIELRIEVRRRAAITELVVESEARFRALADEAPVMLARVDATGRSAFVNRAWREFTGRTEAEPTVGRWLETIHPDDRARVIEGGRRKFGQRQPIDSQYRVRTVEGTYAHVLERSRPFFDDAGAFLGYVGATTDVTERVHLSEALESDERLLGAMFESAPSGVAFFAPDGSLMRINRRMREFLAMPLDEDAVPAFNINDHVGDFSPRLAEAWRAAFRGETARIPDLDWNSNVLPLAGSPGPVRLVADVVLFPTLDDEGRLTAIAATVRDVTEQRRLEQELAQAQKLESLGLMAAGIAHEFNNILAAIMGNVGVVMLAWAHEPDVLASLKDIEAATLKAARLSHQMLDYSGNEPLVAEVVDIGAVAAEALQSFRPAAGVALRTAFAEALPAIEGDPAQLRRAVANLIANSAEALGPAGGQVTVRTGAVYADHEYIASCRQSSRPVGPGRFVYIEVEDDGHGFDRSTALRIFDPFYSTRFHGRGLGLPVVAGTVTGHGGLVHVESEPGKGTRFRLLFPVPVARRA